MMRTVLSGCLAGAVALSGIGLVSLPAAAETEIIASGTFEGRGGHETSGGVTILQTDAGVTVILEPDFSLDGAPDPKLAFGSDGYDASTLFSKLESNDGAQVYVLTEAIDPTEYNELWVWCEQFNVPLGVAQLQ